MTTIELKKILLHRIAEINDISFLKAIKTILDSKTDTEVITLTTEQRNEIIESKKEIEHVYGFMEQSMNGLFLRSVGMVRATGIIGLINLTYNLFRYEQVVRLNILKVK